MGDECALVDRLMVESSDATAVRTPKSGVDRHMRCGGQMI
jgi:hypothetical protein